MNDQTWALAMLGPARTAREATSALPDAPVVPDEPRRREGRPVGRRARAARIRGRGATTMPPGQRSIPPDAEGASDDVNSDAARAQTSPC